MATLTPERLAQLKENANGILSNVRQAILRTQPFIGNVGMKLEIVPVRDRRCPTACTDGKRVFFDIAFLARLNDDQRKFVLAHELWHCVMLHFARRQTREMDMFNIATDLEVNQILKKDGFIAPPNLCWPEKFGFPPDLSAEEYYELLLKNDKKQMQKIANGSGNGKPSDSALNGQFDKHLDKNDAENADSNNGGSGNECEDKYGKVSEDGDFGPSVDDDAVERMRENAISAAQQSERSSAYRGTLPSHISQVIDKLRKPEIRWQEVLAQFVTRCLGEKRQWCPPNRRHVWHDSYLQSRRGEKLRIAVGIDTSGSCTSELPKFLGELNALVKTFGNYELTLIQCDAKVDRVDTYNEYEPLDLDATDFRSYGGGGTRLHPIFEYIDENGVEADATIIFTDGYIEEFPAEDEPARPTLWLITRDGDDSCIHFGDVIKMKESAWND